MNYRHAFHAGNHGDVLKHVALARIVEHLKKKEKPFRIVDAHAGTGSYDLSGIEAQKTGEWRGGIGMLAAPFAPDIEALLAPYRQCIAELNPSGAMRVYPGSPELAARLMRAQDRLTANELHPQDHQALARHFLRDDRVSVTALDAEACIKSQLPPPERRGLALIDPPYEEQGEPARAVRMAAQGLRRFASGIFMIWYPLKADGTAKVVAERSAALGIPGTLMVEMRVREAFTGGGLAGSGLVIFNPPYRLDDEMRLLAPALAGRLGLGAWGRSAVEWLMPPR